MLSCYWSSVRPLLEKYCSSSFIYFFNFVFFGVLWPWTFKKESSGFWDGTFFCQSTGIRQIFCFVKKKNRKNLWKSVCGPYYPSEVKFVYRNYQWVFWAVDGQPGWKQISTWKSLGNFQGNVWEFTKCVLSVISKNINKTDYPCVWCCVCFCLWAFGTSIKRFRWLFIFHVESTWKIKCRLKRFKMAPKAHKQKQ